MKNSRAYIKIISSAIAGALMLMTPGFPAYQALAAEMAAPGAAGLPAASFAPMLRQLSQPQAADPSHSVVSGVEVAPLLQTLSSVDLESAQNRAQVQPVVDALSKLPAGAGRDLMIAAIAGAVANVRAQASGDLSKRDTTLLVEAARYPLLLETEQRQALTRELYRRKEIVAWTMLAAADSWNGKNGNGDRAYGAVGRGALAPAHIGTAASKLRMPTSKAPAQAPTVDRAARRNGAALLLVGAAGAVAMIHGLSPVALLVAAGSMISIVAHEAAHLKMARLRGDDTAAKQGVTSAGKLIDPLGTIALPVFTAVLTGALFGLPLVFGWAKPLPIDFNRPGDVKRSSGLIAVAGPMANFAIAASLGLALLAHPAGLALAAITTLAKINVLLGVFNLLPAGPQFDGFKVLVSFLPRKLYERLTRNERVAPAYQSTFQKLYEGPSALLNAVGMDGQGQVNKTTRLWTLAAFALFALAAHAWVGGPVLLLALVCSYDYYCIREKIQNEAAVKALTDILQGFASELAKAAEEDETIQSTINTEEVEHVLKNALEDILDKVIDSDGFNELTEDQKWERFKNAYTDAAVSALHQKGMSADSEDTIRAFLHKNGSRFFEQLKGWAKEYDVFTKWHSPKRKSDSKDELSSRGEKLKNAGKAMGIIGLGLVGMHFGLPHAAALGLGILGTVAATVGEAKPKTPTFQEAMEDPNLKLDAKQKAFLLMMLSEMKLDEKPPVIGRIEEMSEVYKNVTAPRGGINSVVLIGKAGVGKTAIPEKLAQSLALAELQPDGTFALNKMKGRYLLKLNLSRLLSTDDPPKALDALIGMIANFNDVNKRSGNKIVLFIDEIHQIFLHPKGDLMANILKEPLRDGSIAVIAATTEAEYKKYMENDEAFRRRMVPIPVKESSVAETLRMLQGTRAYYEGLYQLSIRPDALKAAAELSKYDQELFLPGRAFHPLTEALKDADYDGRRDRLGLAIADSINELQYILGRLTEELKTTDRVTEKIKSDEPTTIELYNAAVELSKKLVDQYRQRATIPAEGSPTVTADMVKEQIAKKTGVKSGMLTLGREPMERYLDMEKIVGSRVIGQEGAVHAIAEAVRRNKAGLSDPKRPLGVFYLTGPTGSGKTHLAKELARFLFDDPEAVIRIDMSEYMESHSVSKFIGSPPGYVGYGEGGQLTEKVRKKPYSVVLFDEIEKANPDVWLIMLQILGDGRLTDGQGRTVDFKNTIVLMTSNLGMYALNDMLDPYVTAFVELQKQLDAARAAGNALQIGDIERQQRELSEKVARETKTKTEEVTKEAFKKTYPPEFEGRLSAPPIVFNRITPEIAEDIVKLNLKELGAVMDYAGHELAPASKDVIKFLVEKGFDLRLGARPLQNAIDRHISQPVARKLLEAAMANGDSPKPSRVELSVKNGAIAIDVAALPPKAVTKKDAGEGAAQEVFSQALNLAMHAASDKVAPVATLEVIDGWVRAALSAYPEAEKTEPTESKVASASERPWAPEAPTTPRAEPQPTTGLFIEGSAPALDGSAIRKTSAHYDIERKDADVRAFAKELEAALTNAGYPETTRQALVRTVEEQSNPYLGFVKLFVEQSKKMTPSDRKATNVQLAFEIGDSAVRVVIHRNGPLGDKELTLLKTHFAGTVPENAAAARDKAEALNVMGKDGRRLFFDLHRLLSDMPGARLGVATGAAAQGGAGTDYWIELPKPPRPEPTESKRPSESERAAAPEAPPAAAGPPEQTPPAAQRPEGLVQAATTAPIMSRPETRTINLEAAEIHDPDIRRGIGQVMAQTGGYSRAARIGAMNFLSAVGGFLRDRAVTVGRTEPLTLAWQVTPQETTIVFRSSGRALTAPEIAALQEMFQTRSNLRGRIEESGARVYAGSGEQSFMGSGASIWVVFPTEPVSQADGFAGETPAAEHSASDASSANNSAAAPAAPEGLRSVGWHAFTLDFTKHNPQDQAFRRAQDGLEAALRARFADAAPDVIRLSRKFIDRAAHFAKERARLHAEKIFVEWRLREDGEFEIAVRRESLQPKQFQSAVWQSSLQGLSGMRELLEAAGARLVNEPVASPGRHSHRLAIFLPAPETLRAAQAPAAAQAPRQAPPAPSTHAEQARAIMHRFATAVLAQGDERGPTVLYSAGDLLGAVSTPDDLAKARNDIASSRTSDEWAKIAAAAAVIARQGSRADDEARLRRAIGNVNWGHEHLLNPMRRRVAEALAALLATDNPQRLETMGHDLRGIEDSESGRSLTAYALYLALARHGGPELRQLLVERASESRSEALAEYLRRNDPGFLRHFYLQWRQSRSAPDGLANRLLTLYAIGDYAEADDLPHITRLVLGKWDGRLSTDQIPIAGAIFGRYVARLGLYDGDLKREIWRWVETDLDSYSDWNKSIAAAEALGAAGSEQDAALLERMLRYDPGEVSSTNEITQASAAMAWARLVNRTGLIERYLTQEEPGQNGQPARTRIVKMLTDRNAIVNKAALEAVRMYFTTPRSSIPAPAPPRTVALGEQRDHPRFTTGPLARPEIAFERFSRPDEEAAADPNVGPWLLRLSDARLSAIKAWSAVMKEILGPLLGGAAISRNIQVFPVEDEGSAPVILAWTLFQDMAPAVPAATAARAKELVLLLLHLTSDAPDVRQAKLARLEQEVPGARRAYEATAAVAAIPGARFGYDFDEGRGFGAGQSPFKLWLALDGAAFSPKPAP